MQGTVTYDPNDLVLGYELLSKDSQRLWFSPIADSYSKVINTPIDKTVTTESANKPKQSPLRFSTVTDSTEKPTSPTTTNEVINKSATKLEESSVD